MQVCVRLRRKRTQSHHLKGSQYPVCHALDMIERRIIYANRRFCEFVTHWYISESDVKSTDASSATAPRWRSERRRRQTMLGKCYLSSLFA